MHIRIRTITTCIAVLLACCAFNSQSKVQLNTKDITVSGLSSGGFMANQFHLAHAQIVNGVAIIAAGPYDCAQNSLQTAFAQCLSAGLQKYPEPLLNPYSQENRNKDLIADVQEVQNDRVWLLHGELDSRIVRDVSNGLADQYSSMVKPDYFKYVNDKAFPHVFPTDEFGESCEQSTSPFIANCKYDAAGNLLSHLYETELKARVSTEESLKIGQLHKISQSKLTDISSTSLHEYGYLYVPDSCSNGKECKLHVSFHGCNQAIENVQDTYAKHTGLNRWAATNNIVVLYPQIEGSTIMPMNPQSCWDWWGYTDENYANKKGKQINAVKNMIDNLPEFLTALYKK